MQSEGIFFAVAPDKIEEKGLHALSIDQAVYPPKNRIEPNRTLLPHLG